MKVCSLTALQLFATRRILFGSRNMACVGEGDYSTSKMAQIRKPYSSTVFTEDQLASKDPIIQFKHWYDIAAAHESVAEPNAMTIATTGRDGRPSARMVLLKGFGQDGFKFFTNYRSRKAQELAINPYAALVIYWSPLNRSVRIEGNVERLSEGDSKNYFASRPRPSQIAAHISGTQSAPVKSREVLAEIEKSISDKYKGTEVPKPDFWGGYLVKPHTIEFWHGQSNRVHDRIQFRKLKPGEKIEDDSHVHKGENGWIYVRLSP